MKKNISINISGIIFHIEEDGYETLKKYLDSINRYFSTFEDSSEILADIESRIAEIFLSKLNEEKQVITAEDVNALVTTMGSVNDFKAAEEPEEIKNANTTSGQQDEDAGGPKTFAPPKQLQRDQKRKILGGVCAGLGNYFSVDPLWFRLLFAALLFAFGFTFVVYIIMWIIVPGSYELEEPEFGKKMFRDPKSKIIGGVSGGLAAYFGIDAVIVRVLFILLTFAGGLGFFLYIILWVSLPEAKTITDKMQMQGEPVTLSNIESNIKRNFNIKEGESESTLARILLFPFRLLGLALTALGKVIEPLVDIIRVAVGVVIILMGLALVFMTVVSAAALFGLFVAGPFSTPWIADFHDLDISLEIFTRAFPGWVAVAAVVAILIPSIFLILLGASAIAKRIVFQGTIGWTLFALFFVSAAMLAVGIPRIVYAFHEDGEYKVEQTYNVTGRTAVLRLNDTGNSYDGARLTLRGHQGPDFRLVQTFESQGSSSSQAVKNAQMVEYDFSFADSVFTFSEDLRFKEDAIFRGQHLDMILYIPYDFPFIMEGKMHRILSHYIPGETDETTVWKMTKSGGLECVSCEDVNEQNVGNLRDFREIQISGKFKVQVEQGHDYSIELNSDDKLVTQYKIERSGETLVIEFEDARDESGDEDWKKWNVKGLSMQSLDIKITMPSLRRIEATGLGSIRFSDFNEEEMRIETRGPIKVRGDLQVDDLRVHLTGSSEADLSGHAKKMNARVEFASRLRAYDLEATDAFVEVQGASTAKVNVTGKLEMDEGVASDIDFRGSPQVIKNEND